MAALVLLLTPAFECPFALDTLDLSSCAPLATACSMLVLERDRISLERLGWFWTKKHNNPESQQLSIPPWLSGIAC